MEENHQESTAGSLITAQGWKGGMDRLPWLRVPPGEGKGRQRERIPRNDAARHGPKSRTGRGWRNLPGAPREGQGASTAFPAGPGNSREEPGTEEFRACDKHPFNPALFQRFKNCRENAGSSPAGAAESIPAGNTNREQGTRHSRARRCSQGWARALSGLPCARGAAGMAGLGINSA